MWVSCTRGTTWLRIGQFSSAGVDQVEKVGRNAQGQLFIGQEGSGVFLRRQRWQQPLQLFQRSDAVFELPPPIVPIRFADIGPETPSGRMEFFEGLKFGGIGLLPVQPAKVLLCISKAL